MSWTESFRKKAYPAFLTALLLVAATTLINDMFFWQTTTKTIVAMAVIFTVMYFIADHYKKERRFYGLMAALVITVCVMVFWKRGQVLDFVKESHIVWLALMSAAAGAVLYVTQQYFVCRWLVCGGLWTAMLVGLCLNNYPEKEVTICLAAVLVFLAAETLDLLYYKEKDADRRNVKMFFLWPVLLIFMAVLWLLPYNSYPFKWTRTKRVINKITAVVADVFDSLGWGFNGEGAGEFGLSFVGFGDSGILGGNIAESESRALRLRMVGVRESLYLTGNIKSDYTGSGWTHSPDNESSEAFKEYQLDTFELLYAAYREGILGGNGITGRYLLERNININYGKLTTASMFRPSNLYFIKYADYRGKFSDSGENLFFTKNQDADTSYDVFYLTLNRNSTGTERLIRNQGSYVYDTLSPAEYSKFLRTVNRTFSNIYTNYTASPKNYYEKISGAEDFEGLLKKRAEYIRETYLGLPGSVGVRTYALAEKITAECDNDYDKMKAIAEYLGQYEYTTSPGKIPKDTDAVEYFLFETKKGYCTYFASAAAILGRCVGIPTRYVQGYLLDIGRMGAYSSYEVEENQAHAWIEAYIEGVGWLTFDATPGSFEYLYQRWDNPYVTYIDEEPDDNPEKADNPDEERKPSVGDVSGETDGEDESLPEEETTSGSSFVTKSDEAAADGETKPEKSVLGSLVMYAMLAAAVLIIVYLIQSKVRESRFWHIYEKSEPSMKVYLDMWMLLWLFGRAGFSIGIDEPLSAYIDRIKHNYPEQEEALVETARVYQRIRYSENKAPTPEEQRMARRVRISIMKNSSAAGMMARQGLAHAEGINLTNSR